MSDATSLFSILLSSNNQAATLRVALDSILAQEHPGVECFVVDEGSTDGSIEILREYQGRIESCESVTASEVVRALNRAMAQTRGEYMMWLDAGEKLCPWACRLAAFLFCRLDDVKWLTSGTPIVWSPSQLAIAKGYSDGYARIPFLRGRNSKTSSYFHHPIWRAGTFWRRSVWDASGSRIEYPLGSAGDFELWARFFQVADLTNLSVPVAGEQVIAPLHETDAYWRAAAAHLQKRGGLPSPSKIQILIKEQLKRRLPKQRRRFAYRAPHIWIAPPTEECGISTHYII